MTAVGTFDSSTFTPEISIRPDVAPLVPDMVQWRRWFHAHPELSFQEVETAKEVARILRSFGIEEVFEKCGRTGVVALIRGGRPGPCILLRADMDALPLPELGSPNAIAGGFVSKNAGVMHACGHDGHMSSLLGAAKVLFSKRATLAGTIKLCFQPAEEGYGGAREMIADGILEETAAWGPRVDEVYGAHLWSYDAVGRVGARHGPMMAASDKFTIDVVGKGGHGAAPHGTVDAIVVASTLVNTLQTVVSRNKDPLEAGVLTVGMMHGGSGYNIICDRVELAGTCRSFTPATQELMKARMHEVCCGIGAAYGADVRMDYKYGYPPTINSDEAGVRKLHEAARKVVGKGAGVPYITCGAEDFSYFLQQRPGCFFFVGARIPHDEERPHHKSVFDFDEAALPVAASVFVQLAEDILA